MKAAVRTLTIAAVAAWAMAASQAYGLSNGDFEAHSTMGWQVYNPDAQVLSWNVTSDPAHVHGGAYAGALTAFGGTESLLIVYNTQSVAEWPSGALARTRVYIKTVGLELADPLQGFRVIFVAYDASSQVVSYHYANGALDGDHDYTLVEVLSTLPAGTATVQVQFVLHSGIVSGAIYMDDAMIEQVTDLGAVSTDLPACRVQPDPGGTPRLEIDGQVVAPNFLFENCSGAA